jgi:RNA polymerase sigma-B factor
VETEALLREYAAAPRPALRDAIIERHGGLVRSLAQKFARPAVPAEDLTQTAWVALIRAVDRFDPARETKFSTYAVHCMVGEIKRYFRDRTWSLRVPRELQEIHTSLPRREEELSQRLGRSPTVAEMAEALGISEETLLQAMDLGEAYQPRSLADQRELQDGNDAASLEESVGRQDPALERVVERAPVQAALATLDERLQTIVRRRFYYGFSQQEVADELGLSQMHVSRLERLALRRLREVMGRA